MIRIHLIVFIVLMLKICLVGQSFLNLDFEYKNVESDKPQRWTIAGDGYHFHLDSIIKVKGKYSLKIARDSSSSGNLGIYRNSFSVDLVKGKKIVFKGKIKTEKVKDGFAALWWRVGGKEGLIAQDNMQDRSIKETQNWTPVKIEMDISPEATDINFGGILVGEGIAWFDELEIFIEGEKFKEQPPRTTLPTAEELNWLKKAVIPLKSWDPLFDNNEDLEALKKRIGNPRIIALGESSHGAREIFMMKHRIIKYLREYSNYDLFSIEASMPESYNVNKFTLEGKGDPADLIRGMHFWTSGTETVLNMINWMKNYNDKHNNKIIFTGFDMQYYEGAIYELKTLLKKESKLTLLDDLEWIEIQLISAKRKARINRKRMKVALEKKGVIKTKLTELEIWINKDLPKTSKKAYYLQMIRILRQLLDRSPPGIRDSYMAENFNWIMEQNKESNAIVWAHNEHIRETGNKMGDFLSQKYKDDYLSIGFAFHEGEFTANGDSGLGTYIAESSYPGTYEYFFQAIDEPFFLLDLRNIPANSATRWLTEENNLKFRQLGARDVKNQFKEQSIIQDFDMIIFIDTINPSKLLYRK